MSKQRRRACPHTPCVGLHASMDHTATAAGSMRDGRAPLLRIDIVLRTDTCDYVLLLEYDA